jgi:hypothetical protein
MDSIVTKGEFAAMLGVERSTVSTWIARGQLTAPALLPDGRIDVVLGKAMLADRIDLAKSRGRAPTGLFANVDKPAPLTEVDRDDDAAAPAGDRIITGYGERIARARGDLLQLELDRKKLARQVGAGLLIRAVDFTKTVATDLSMVIATVDGQLPEWVTIIRGAATHDEAKLAIEKQLDRLREWQQ